MGRSGNRVWTVRAGSDGSGVTLFDVYQPDMDTARKTAGENLRMLGFSIDQRFTVHAAREDERLSWFERAENNMYATRPALDFGFTIEIVMVPTETGMRRHAVVTEGIQGS